MNSLRLRSAILTVMLVVFITLIAQAQYTIPKNVFGSGAVTSDNNNYKMIGTIGQPLIGANKNSSFNEFIGFWYNKENITVSVKEISDNIPIDFLLEQNYPNPFTDYTTITLTRPSVTLSYRERVGMRVYDIFGREVLDLSDEVRNNSTLKIQNSQLPSPGIYFYRLTTPTFSQTRSMLYMK